MALLSGAGPNALAAEDGERARLALFELAAGSPARALNWVAQEEGEQAQLMKARAWLETGSKTQAGPLLRQLAEQGNHVRGSASLTLAKLAIADGNPEAAGRWLAVAMAKSGGDERAQAQYLMAELARREENFDQAGKTLARMEPGYWAALGYTNLALDYASLDRDPARALVALRVALAMAAEDADQSRMGDLSTRILVKAGVLSHRRGDYDKAIGFLNKVALDSYLAPQALYFHGLAQAANGNYRAAMQSWHRARKFPLAFPGAADAWLGMGRGYDESGYLGQAGEAYLAAIAAFESEQVSIDTLSEAVRKQGAYEALIKAAGRDDVEWFLADSRTLTQPRIAYLLHFMAEPESQRAALRVAELSRMARELERRRQDLSVFIDSLAQRAEDLRLGVGASSRESTLAALDAAIADLAARWKALSARAGEEKAKVAELAALRQTLNDLNRRRAAFPSRLQQAPEQLAGLVARARQARAEVTVLQQRLAALLVRAEQALDQRALAYLSAEREQVAHSLDRAEQQIAHLYEHLALTELARGGQND
ncbi:MAG: hypothetical protein R3280_00905 [Marinobacter sp.]|uniref:hypothetical protein n=1 Tax=Marinobacter sp. TaxID=50741 RepID=UPI00299F27F0|nr:hypothetical protein [Marinobacter sp.]MDX1633171.1 hypothetical protein [Marinobacter sp.]